MTTFLARKIKTPIGEFMAVTDELERLKILVMNLPERLAKLEKAYGKRGLNWRLDENSGGLVHAQLEAFFAGDLHEFDLDLAPEGTPFQHKVWRELLRIPHGEVISYGQLARRIGQPSAARGVGAANGANPICIVVPCHRVVGSDGSLTGFAYGLDVKAQLLRLEGHRLSVRSGAKLRDFPYPEPPTLFDD